MAIRSRQELMEYCLRSLGAPLIQVNCDEEQLDDRIEDAIEYWRLYHSESDQQIHMKQLITASILNITTETAPSFEQTEIVTGSISGAIAIVTTEGPHGPSVNKPKVLLVKSVTGLFQAGETITGSISNSTAILDTIPCVLGVWDQKWIYIPDLVYGITNILSINNNNSSTNNIFGIEYQMRLNDLHDVSSLSMIYYHTAMSYIDLLHFELNRTPLIRFNRLQNRLYIDMNWDTDVVIGTYIIIECYRVLDPEEFPRMLNELWLKRYTTAQFKKQWGQNLSKFNGVILPGGTSIDGNAIYSTAVEEIAALEDELMSKSSPLNFFCG